MFCNVAISMFGLQAWTRTINADSAGGSLYEYYVSTENAPALCLRNECAGTENEFQLLLSEMLLPIFLRSTRIKYF